MLLAFLHVVDFSQMVAEYSLSLMSIVDISDCSWQEENSSVFQWKFMSSWQWIQIQKMKPHSLCMCTCMYMCVWVFVHVTITWPSQLSFGECIFYAQGLCVLYGCTNSPGTLLCFSIHRLPFSKDSTCGRYLLRVSFWKEGTAMANRNHKPLFLGPITFKLNVIL